MNIRLEDWVRYRDKLSTISEKAADAVRDYIWKEHGGLNDVTAEDIIAYTKAVVDRYSDASSELACQMYDEIAEAQKANVPPAEPAESADYGEVAKAIHGVMKQSPDGNLIGDPASRFTKRAAADTMLKNAKRDGAEFAWIPSGDGCAFCQMIASRGWQRASKQTIQGNHADHVHANCKCQFAIRFDGRSSVEGYNPEKLRKKYDEAEGNTWQEKLNSMRKDYREEHKDEINAQKRAAYEKNNNGITDEEYINSKIRTGQWGTVINPEKQAHHMEKTREEGKSYIFDGEDPQKLYDQYHGKGRLERDRKGRRTNKEVVTIDHDIGIDYTSGEKTDTIKIHHSKNRTHIVPIRRKQDV